MFRSIYFSIVLFGCTFGPQQDVVEIDSKRLIELQESGVKIVDIRTSKEYNQGHIPNVIHVDFFDPDFVSKMEALGIKEPVVIHCAKGGRSKKAGILLEQAGFSKVYDYSGGFADWKSKGMEVEK